MTDVPAGPAKPNIAAVADEFLQEQGSRLSAKRLSKYRQVIDLFCIYLDGYWPGESQEAYGRITKMGGTFCTWFGPDRIPGGYSEFLGYYMGHKVMGGMETKRAAGTVMKLFAEWLAGKGYIRRAEEAVERSKRASKQLPAAEGACRILEACARKPPRDQVSGEIEDHFSVVRVEPGKIWLTPLSRGLGTVLGPIPVPARASSILKADWDVSGVVGKTSHGWRLIEVWNVSAF